MSRDRSCQELSVLLLRAADQSEMETLIQGLLTPQEIVEIVSVQNRCNLFERQVFHDGVLKKCEEQNIAFIPHSPVGGQLGHWRSNEDGTLKMVAKMCGITTYQACLAWLLAKSPVMLPIPGASRIESAQSSAAAADMVMDDFAITLLDSVLPE